MIDTVNNSMNEFNFLNKKNIIAFQKHIWKFYQREGRKFTWRDTDDPYHIVVSEIMLQQTQTYRVEPKFEQFIIAFPDFACLAHASLRDVLSIWQGLGYNRRALALQKIAQIVVSKYDGILPQLPEILESFPGIGKATAASICTFAFNYPAIFIETNIRAVFIHHFFQGKNSIKDSDILSLVEATLDRFNPCEWYYALMDYGVAIKKLYKNPSKKSAHYTKQSKFEGSDRQIRGMVLKVFTINFSMTLTEIIHGIDREPQRIEKALSQLCNEGFIKQCNNKFVVA